MRTGSDKQLKKGLLASEKRMPGIRRPKLHRFLQTVTRRQNYGNAEESADSTRQLAAIVISWLLVAVVIGIAVLGALYFQRKAADLTGPRPTTQADSSTGARNPLLGDTKPVPIDNRSIMPL